MFAQQVHKIPFAAKDNTVQLILANGSSIAVSNISVKPVNLPSWIRMQESERTVSSIRPLKEQIVEFTFHVDKSAPVRQEQELEFTIASASGETWTKKVRISVNAPDKFVLYQNYPNPFNPTTTISYELPHSSKVVLQVYNILGEKVADLYDGEREAGYFEERWDASNAPSGFYFYQLTYIDEQHNQHFERKKMMVVK
jgi:hypothetical protein